MSNHHWAVAIMARRPQLSKVKTRLAKDVGDTAALKIYKELLHRSMNTATSGNWSCFLFLTGQGDLDASGFEVVAQLEGNLGEKMSHVFKTCFQKGFQKVVLIGSDIDGLEVRQLEEAFHALDTDDLVIGPTYDGGYYLIGMNNFADLFSDIEWSTSNVLFDSLQRAERLNKSVKLIEKLNDIDTFQDFCNSSLRNLDLN